MTSTSSVIKTISRTPTCKHTLRQRPLSYLISHMLKLTKPSIGRTNWSKPTPIWNSMIHQSSRSLLCVKSSSQSFRKPSRTKIWNWKCSTMNWRCWNLLLSRKEQKLLNSKRNTNKYCWNKDKTLFELWKN